jgi:hypothetical protein
MRVITERQLEDANRFAAYVTACTAALFFAGVIATFLQ